MLAVHGRCFDAKGSTETSDLADDAVGAGHRLPGARVDHLGFDDALPRNGGPSTGNFVRRVLEFAAEFLAVRGSPLWG